MNIINVARAAENNIVSCTGSDCSLCSLLGTVSNVYNFFLGVSFAVAVLVLVIVGVNYLLAGGNRNKIQKSLYFLKSGIGGFAFIILGWLVIQTAAGLTGYDNAGEWWRFQCRTESDQTLLETQDFASLRNEYYDNLKTFPDLSSYLKSGERQAKITGPVDEYSFRTQLKGLKDGEVLHFLAPARVDSMNGSENLFLPLLTVLKEGGNMELSDTGEYWDLIKNMWPKFANNNVETQDFASLQKDLLDKLLGTDSYTDDRSLIALAGDQDLRSLQSDDADFSSLYQTIAQVLDESLNSGDRSVGTRYSAFLQDEDLSKLSLSELIARAAQYQEGEDENSRMIALLTTETIRLVSMVMVDKEEADDILSSASWRCVESGGEWVNEECECPGDNVLGQDGTCRSSADLKNNCENSSGEWENASEGYNSTPLCGSAEDALSGLYNSISGSGSERANISQVVPDKEYCKCADKFCLDNDGSCRKQAQDDDGDKIANTKDRCPDTPSTEKGEVVQTMGSKFYGCGCSEIGVVKKNCPPDQCVGDSWVVYPGGKQECQGGKLLVYSCEPVERNFDQSCVEQNKLADSTQTQDQTTQEQGAAQNSNTNSTQPPYMNSSNQGKSSGSKSNSGNKSSTANKGGKNGKSGNSKPISDNWGDRRTGGVPDTNDPGQSFAGPQGVKEALKRIYQKDKLRYLMVFKYTSKIYNQGGGNSFSGAGVTWGCGTYAVTFGSGYKMLASIIAHECTHSGDFCNGAGNLPSMEYVAVGNQIGSVGRIKESPGQKEEIKVTLNEGKGQEVRGFGSRLLDRDINPTGDENSTGIGSWVSYAKGYKAESGGNWLYGYPPGGDRYTLRLNDNEHNRVLRIMETLGKRNCMTRPPEDLPQLEEKDYSEALLRGCKEAPVLKIGN